MRYGMIGLLWAVALAALGESFYLRSEDGERLGPFEVEQGKPVALGGVTYTVERDASAEAALEARMRSIVLKDLSIQEATIAEAFETIVEGVRKSGAADGLRLVLMFPDAEWMSWPSMLSATETTLYDAVKVFCDFAGLRWRLRDGAVEIVSRRVPDGPLYYRFYRVMPGITQNVSTPGEWPLPDGVLEVGEAGWEDLFVPWGVSWPDGASVRYEPTLGRMVVVNTAENHRKLDVVLNVLRVLPKQIQVELQFVHFKKGDVDALALDGEVTLAELVALREAGKSTLVAAPKVVTKSGYEATLKGVLEMIYPTEFSVTGLESGTEEGVAGTVGAVVEPGQFETREVGVILTVVPQFDTVGDGIVLSLTPEWVRLNRWLAFAQERPNGGGQVRLGEQPIFDTRSLSTSVRVRNGGTVLLGGGVLAPDGEKALYLFLTARAVSPDGTPLRSVGPELFPVD